MSSDRRLIIHPFTDDQIRNSSEPKAPLQNNDNHTFHQEDQIKSDCISGKETHDLHSSPSFLFLTKTLSNGAESHKVNSADAETFCSETEDQPEEDIEDQHYRRRKQQVKEEKEDFPLDADIEWDVIFENMNKAKLESQKDEVNKKTQKETIYKKTSPFIRSYNVIRQPKSPNSTSPPCPNYFSLPHMMNIPAPPQYHQYPNFNAFPYHYIPAPPSNPFYYGFSNHQISNISSPESVHSVQSVKTISGYKKFLNSPVKDQVESINKKRKCPGIPQEKTEPSMRVCVSNIPRDLNKMDFLTRVFKKFGNIVDLKIQISENKAQVLYSKEEEALKALEVVGKLKDSLFNSQDIILSSSTTPDCLQSNHEIDLIQMVQERLTDKLRDLIATQKDQPGFVVKMKLLKLLLRKINQRPCELEKYKNQLRSFGIHI